MEDKSGIKKFLAGLFFIMGVGLIAMVIFIIGFDRGLGQPKFQVITLFREVGGLIEGAPIRVSGVNVGVVGNIDFMAQPINGRSLKVTLNIYKKYETQFRKCSRISIKTEGVLGRKLVEVNEDYSRNPFDLTKPILGEDPLDVEDMAAVITRTALTLQKTSTDVSDVLTEWKYISKKTRRVVNRFEDKLVEGSLFKIF